MVLLFVMEAIDLCIHLPNPEQMPDACMIKPDKLISITIEAHELNAILLIEAAIQISWIKNDTK